MSLGASKSSSRQSSSSSSSQFGLQLGQSNTFLDQQQQANQQGLVNQFMDTNFNVGGQIRDATMMANQGFRGVGGNMANAYAGLQPQLMNFGNAANMGTQALAAYSQGSNPYLDAQISGLAGDAGRFLNEQLLPGITSQFAQGGQRGSSRAALAAGQAAGRVGEQFANQAMNLRAGAYNQGAQSAAQLAQLGGQQYLQGQGLGVQMLGQQGDLWNQYGRFGLDSAEARQYQQLRPFQIGAGVIGGPSILSSSSQFGLDTSSSEQKSKGKSSSMSISGGMA